MLGKTSRLREGSSVVFLWSASYQMTVFDNAVCLARQLGKDETEIAAPHRYCQRSRSAG